MPEHVRISFRDDVETARAEFLDSRRSEIGEHEQHEKHLLGRTGKRFWQDESEDHRVRKSREYERIIHSIEENPFTVALGPWSRRRLAGETACPTHFGSQPNNVAKSKLPGNVETQGG